MKIKNLFALILALALTLSLCSCGAKEKLAPGEAQAAASAEGSQSAEAENNSETQELIVFAAASMTETLTRLGDAFMSEHPDVKIGLGLAERKISTSAPS